MIEIVWQLDRHPLTTEAVVRPLIEAVCATPSFHPARYDLNRREQWRLFDLDHLVVDTLTQRTQLVRIAGEGDQLVMIATGKHGEQPVMMMQLPGVEVASVKELCAGWEALFLAVPVQSARISSQEWRVVVERVLGRSEPGPTLGMAHAWRRGSEPDGLAAAVGETEHAHVRLDTFPNHVQLSLADEPVILNSAHEAVISRLHRL